MSYETAEGIRRSDLWVINKSPAHFKYHMEHRDEKTSKALEFGIAAHEHLLQTNEFLSSHVFIPNIDKRTKDGRESYQSLVNLCESKGKTPFSQDDLIILQNMYARIRANELAWQLLQGKHEQEWYWEDDITGEKCKCKTDCITEYEGQPYIVDYKTADSCEDGHFERSVRKYGYQFQAGMYCEGVFQNTLEEHGFAFVAQEKNPPYAVRVYICDREWIKTGYDKYRELIGIYHDCNITGNWYGYEGPDGIPVELVEV